MPVKTQYDFIVVGSGPSGRRAAIQAAKLGKSVLVVEGRRRVGAFRSTPAPFLQDLARNGTQPVGLARADFMAAPIASRRRSAARIWAYA
jgi:flavin-dependent dehydrogenase